MWYGVQKLSCFAPSLRIGNLKTLELDKIKKRLIIKKLANVELNYFQQCILFARLEMSVSGRKTN